MTPNKAEKIQLDLTGDEAFEYIEFFESKKKKLIADYPEVFNRLRDYENQISKLLAAATKGNSLASNGTTPGFIENGDDYPKGGSWNQKIQFFLRGGANFTARQVKDFVSDKEKVSPLNKAELKRIGIGVAASLSSGNGNLYKRTTNEKGDYLYSMKEKKSL